MTAKKKSTTKTASKTTKDITFNYIKTPSYRTFYVDGFYGGLTAKGYLYAEFFLERLVTPQKETYGVKDNRLGAKIASEGKHGVVREIEAGMIMDFSTMLVLQKWLNEKIAEHQSIFGSPTKH